MLLDSKRAIGPELEVGIRVADIEYLLPWENGKLAPTYIPKSVSPYLADSRNQQ